MPVPPSTLVLAIATAIPFGLAIRDTASGKYDDHRYSFHSLSGEDEVENEEATEALQRYGEEQQQLAELREQERLAARKEQEDQRAAEESQLKSLYGAEVASVGSLFEGVRLGAAKQAEQLRKPGLDVMLLDDGVLTHTLFIKISSRDAPCTELRLQLRDVWGAGEGSGEREVWLNEVMGQRAVVDSTAGCELRFERVVPLASWIDRTLTAAVPMGVIGHPIKELTDQLGPRANVDDGSISWTVPSVGIGTGTTSLTAYTRGTKVVGLLASLSVEPVTQDQIVARISKLVGKQPPAGEVLTWSTTPRITVEPSESQIFLRIGEQPGR